MSNSVQQYFHEIHDDFDRIYREDKSPMRRLADQWFRKSIEARLHHALALQKERGYERILDVGCGSGRSSAALALLGAKKVVGIDFAPAMIADAVAQADKAGVADRCEFITQDFLQYENDAPFGLSLAMGVFDYTPDPVPILSRMGRMATTVLGSFPVRAHVMTPVRKVRLGVKGVPVRFYSEAQIRRAAAAASLSDIKVTRLHRDFVLEARGTAPASSKAARSSGSRSKGTTKKR